MHAFLRANFLANLAYIAASLGRHARRYGVERRQAASCCCWLGRRQLPMLACGQLRSRMERLLLARLGLWLLAAAIDLSLPLKF